MPAQSPVSVVLPWPPAVNNLYLNVKGRGRVKSPRYSNWLNEAGWIIGTTKTGRIAGPYQIEIHATRPDKRKRDLDGICKPILDCLVKNGVTDDDSIAQRITLAWSAEGSGVRVVITEYTP
jgi:crossover junction endodeoxyribonuclease RusA